MKMVTKSLFCSYCRLLYDRHLVTGVGGNLSVRVGERFFLTPTGYSLRDIRPESVVVLDAGGKVLEGGTPTKDVNMHLRILRTRSDVRVVCHIHGASLIALSTLVAPGPDVLPPITPGYVYFAYPMPMVPFMVPGSEQLAEETARQLSTKERSAVLLQNHGLVAVGGSLEEALNVAEEVDEAARVFLETGGRAQVIPAQSVEEIKALRGREQGKDVSRIRARLKPGVRRAKGQGA